MEETKSAKFLFEMNCEEAKKIIGQRKSNKDSLVSQIQFGRLAKHCLGCEKCDKEAKEVGLLISRES